MTSIGWILQAIHSIVLAIALSAAEPPDAADTGEATGARQAAVVESSVTLRVPR